MVQSADALVGLIGLSDWDLAGTEAARAGPRSEPLDTARSEDWTAGPKSRTRPVPNVHGGSCPSSRGGHNSFFSLSRNQTNDVSGRCARGE